MHAIALAPNTLASFYRGAERIAAFRDDPAVDPAHAEDWLASTTSRFGTATTGATSIGGDSLAAVLARDPQGWLGPEHLARYGPIGATLVKLLDAGVRLPVHVHPDRAFAGEHLASPFGKSEAWLVLRAEPGAGAYLGFARDVGAAELADWVERQDVPALLGACNQVPLHAGDVLYCPGGVPHSIDAGVLILEVQEMTDFSIMLEWDGFPIDHDTLFLGLPRDTALQAVDRGALRGDALEALRGRTIRALDAPAPGVTSLLPGAADPLFRAEQAVTGTGRPVEFDQRFSLLVVTGGAGQLRHRDGTGFAVSRGGTYLVPYSAGPVTLSGEVSAIRCSSAV